MARLRDAIVRCQACGAEAFYDDASAKPLTCWVCFKPIRLPPLLRIGDRALMLNAGTRVYSHHLRLDYDFTTAIADVVEKPDAPGTWGLRNLGRDAWSADVGDRKALPIAPGRAVQIGPRTRVSFGPVRGRFEFPGTS